MVPPKHTEMFRNEIDAMLKGDITTPATVAWYFPVVIATRNDEKSRFCADCIVLNQWMRTD